jgi:hypothetical protein
MTPGFFNADSKGSRRLEEVLREAWLGALGALSAAEGELFRMRDRLRETMVGDESFVADVLARIRQSQEQLERRVDDGVRATLARTTMPLNTEITMLRGRLEILEQRIDALARRRAGQDAAPSLAKPGSTEGDQ